MGDCVFSDDEDKKVKKNAKKKSMLISKRYKDLIYFFCKSIEYDNKGRKKMKMPVGWQKLEKSIDNIDNPKVVCVLTGKKNGITVFDFDCKDRYEEAIEKYPILEECFTVSTKKGYHVYCKYNKDYKQTTNEKINMDIRNDGGFVFGSGTRTENGSKYETYINGRMDIEIPMKFYEEYFGNIVNDKVDNKESKNNKVDDKKNNENNSKKENKKYGHELNYDDTKEKLVDLIDKKYMNDYSTWTKLVWSGKNSGISKEKLIEMSMKSEKFDEKGFDKVYKYSYPSFTLGTIKYYARLSNVKEYVKILNNDFCNNPEEYTDMFLAKVIINLCVDTFVHKDKDLYTYYKDRWRIDNERAFLKKIAKNILDEYVNDMLISVN